MNYFLIVYERSTGVLQELQEFGADEQAALSERFRREFSTRNRAGIEIVVLGAESRQDLQRTHSRYFKTPRELAASG